MNNIYCSLAGKEPTMFVKLLLKLFLFAVLAVTKILFGMDWALIVAAVIVVSDLDEIASLIQKKLGGKCE